MTLFREYNFTLMLKKKKALKWSCYLPEAEACSGCLLFFSANPSCPFQVSALLLEGTFQNNMRVVWVQQPGQCCPRGEANWTPITRGSTWS